MSLIPLLPAPTPFVPPPIAITPEIEALLARHAPVAVGVSGGKDSDATALRLAAFLDAIGHRGPRVLVHADLGIMEWRDSLPACQRLADRLGWELIVVRRPAGDLLSRIKQRWANNVQRYIDLACVKLILPWPTAAMRLCTAELKEAPNARALVQRFPGETIISVTGVRRQESPKRAKAPIAKVNNRLTSVTHGTSGLTWNPLLDWTIKDVWAYLQSQEHQGHEAYRIYQTSRVSCCYCILASKRDLEAAARCEENHAVYRELVRLEVRSTFSFQERQWLADIAPHLLDDDLRAALVQAKAKAVIRMDAEANIPKHLWYTKGWPTAVPTWDEAVLLGEVRRTVGATLDLPVRSTEPAAIQARYQALMAEAAANAARKEQQHARKQARTTARASVAA